MAAGQAHLCHELHQPHCAMSGSNNSIARPHELISAAQGQRCTAVKVVMVHESVADELVAKVHEKVKALTVGKPEDNCDICAVISEGSANWIEELVTGALSFRLCCRLVARAKASRPRSWCMGHGCTLGRSVMAVTVFLKHNWCLHATHEP